MPDYGLLGLVASTGRFAALVPIPVVKADSEERGIRRRAIGAE